MTVGHWQTHGEEPSDDPPRRRGGTQAAGGRPRLDRVLCRHGVPPRPHQHQRPVEPGVVLRRASGRTEGRSRHHGGPVHRGCSGSGRLPGPRPAAGRGGRRPPRHEPGPPPESVAFGDPDRGGGLCTARGRSAVTADPRSRDEAALRRPFREPPETGLGPPPRGVPGTAFRPKPAFPLAYHIDVIAGQTVVRGCTTVICPHAGHPERGARTTPQLPERPFGRPLSRG